MSLSKPLTEVEKIRHLKDGKGKHGKGKDGKGKQDSTEKDQFRDRQAMTEVEKIRYLQQKYQDSRRLYTVYERSGEEGRFVFSLIYGTNQKRKATRYVQRKELEGLFLIVYCARPQERSSRCVYVSGLQNVLSPPTPSASVSSPGSDASVSSGSSPDAPEAQGAPLNGRGSLVVPSQAKVIPGASRAPRRKV